MPQGKAKVRPSQTLQKNPAVRQDEKGQSGSTVTITHEDMAHQIRQWEVAARILAEIAVRATSKTSVKKTVIESVAWPLAE